MKGDTRCVDGRIFRHDPQPDDPDLETDIGECPTCDGGRTFDCPVPDTVVRAVQIAAAPADETIPPLPPARRRPLTCPHCGGELPR